MVAARPPGLCLPHCRERLLVSPDRPNPRSLAGHFRGSDPLLCERGQRLHPLGKIRQLGEPRELTLADRKDPAILSEPHRQLCSSQLASGEEEPAIGGQPESVIERDAPIERMWRQRRRLQPEAAGGRVLGGGLLARPLVFPDLSLAPVPGLHSDRPAGREDAYEEEEPEAFHERSSR